MDAAAIERIESSFNLLAPRGPELVDRFYAMLFARYPAVRPMFPTEMTAQKRKLLSSIALVIQNLRNLEQIRNVLFEMGRRHAGYGAQPTHYVAVRDTLIDVMAALTGPQWTAQLTGDWKAAFDFVADRMLEGHAAAKETATA
ncbi:MAG: hypothetical protein AMXMBFR47_42030 [Planctomycetota bacterium]